MALKYIIGDWDYIFVRAIVRNAQTVTPLKQRNYKLVRIEKLSVDWRHNHAPHILLGKIYSSSSSNYK